MKRNIIYQLFYPKKLIKRLITFNVLITSLCLGFLFSCSDLLKEEPYGVYSNDNYFQTEEDALNSVLYAYDPINNIEYCQRFLFYLMDVPTNQYRSYNKALETPLFNWEINPNADEFTYFFKYAYLSINRANNVLENVSKMKNITERAKQQYLGEAYFLRAFNYFMLVRTFGEVPLLDKVVESITQTRASYASLDKLYSFIIEDLEMLTVTENAVISVN